MGQDLPSHPLVRHVEEVHVVLGWGPCPGLVAGAAGGKSRGWGTSRLLLGHLVGVPLGPAIAVRELGTPVPAGSWNTPSRGGITGGPCMACTPRNPPPWYPLLTSGCRWGTSGGRWTPAATSALRCTFPCGLWGDTSPPLGDSPQSQPPFVLCSPKLPMLPHPQSRNGSFPGEIQTPQGTPSPPRCSQASSCAL